MFNSKRTEIYSSISGLTFVQLGPICLLLAYFLVFVSAPPGIPHSHHESEVHNWDICHQDACHMAIYHPGSQEGCHHKSHLSNACEECSICQLVLSRDHLLPEVLFQYNDVKESNIVFGELSGHLSRMVIVSRDRGPPYHT